LGYYSIAVAIAETILLITDAVAIAILPRQMTGSLTEAAALALRAARLTGMLAVGAALFWLVTGWAVIGVVFGQDFAPAYLPLCLLLPGIVFMGVQRFTGAVVLRTGMAWRYARVYAISLGCNVALNLWRIP